MDNTITSNYIRDDNICTIDGNAIIRYYNINLGSVNGWYRTCNEGITRKISSNDVISKDTCELIDVLG